MRSLASWLAVAALSVLAAGCPSGGGGGGGGNHAPVAVDDTATTSEETPVTIDATANDTDEDDDVIFVFSFTEATNGTVYIDQDGTLLYEPDPEFAGTDTFTYDITDGGDEPATATVTVTVSTVGDSPVSIEDEYDAIEDTTLVVSMQLVGVLANDTDIDSSPITAAVDSSTQNGDLTLAADGTFTYVPDADFSGVDSFTYHATDGTQSSSPVSVFITVAPVNDAPVAAADSYNATEDTTLVVDAANGVIQGTGEDTDIDGDTLVAILDGNPAHGTVALAADGSFSYTPVADYNGPDSFTYDVWDGAVLAGPATVTLAIANANDAPLTAADSYTVQEGGTLVVAAPGLVGNDVDPDGDTVLAAAPIPVGTPSNGILTATTDGAFTYTPNADYFGTDSFSYRATDGAATSGIEGVTIDVTPVNDPPSFVKGSNVLAEEDDAPVSIPGWATNISSGPANEAGQAVSFEIVVDDPSLFATGPSVDAAGALTFTLAPESFGSTAAAIVAVDDGATPSNPVDDARSSPQIFFLSITEVNDPPSFTESTTVISIDEDAGEHSVPGYATNISAGPGEQGEPVGFVVDYLGGDTLNFDVFPAIDVVTGELTFTASADSFGFASFQISLCDTASCDTRSLDIVVNPVNDPPSFVAGPPVSVLDTVVFGPAIWASNTDEGAGEQGSGQFLTFGLTFDEPADAALFDVVPQITWAPPFFGNLSFEPATGMSGDAEISVVITDDGGTPGDGSDDLSSSPQPLFIAVRTQADPPGVLSTNLFDGDLLSQGEAFGGNGVLNPLYIVFDDPELDCASVAVDLTREGSPLGYTRDCGVAGTLALYVDPFTSAADGDLVQLDLSDVCDTVGNCLGTTPSEIVFSRSVTVDTVAPALIEEYDPFECQQNQRVVARFDEALSASSVDDFVFSMLDAGPMVPVVPEAAGIGTLELTSDTFYFVPRDLLVPTRTYQVSYNGLTDAAGNPVSGVGDRIFQPCGQAPDEGGGPGDPAPAVVSVDWLDNDQLPFLSFPTSAIEDRRLLAPSSVDGLHYMELVPDLDALGGVVDSFDLTVSAFDAEGNFQAIAFANPSPTGLQFDIPWRPDYRFRVSGFIQGPNGTFDIGFDVYVLDDTDVIAPEIRAIAARRASPVTPSMPRLRAGEPLVFELSEEIDPASIDASSVVVTGPSGAVAVDVTRRDDATFSRLMELMRPVGVDGKPTLWAEGSYTVSMSGLLDFGDPQNALAPVMLPFEVVASGTTPTLVASTPADGSTRVSAPGAGPGPIFGDPVLLTFSDAMTESLFSDAPVAAQRGVTLTETITGTLGTLTIPFRGFDAVQYGEGDAFEQGPEVVRLDFNSQDNGQLLGFRPERGYELTLEGSVIRNVDGVALGGDVTISWDTKTDGTRAPLIVRADIGELRIFPIPLLDENGNPLETRFSFQVEARDSDADLSTLDVEGAGTLSFPGGPGMEPGTLVFGGTLAATDLSTLLPSGTLQNLTFRVTDAQAQQASVTYAIRRPATPGAPFVNQAGPFPVISGSIGTADAPFVESVELAIVEVDESGATPQVVATMDSRLVQLSRTGSGATWSVTLDDVVLPDRSPNVYRAVSAARVPFVRGPGRPTLVQFSAGSLSAINPNAPPEMVTLTGSIQDSNGDPISGALIEVVGTTSSTTTLADGSWQMTARKNQTRSLRMTAAGYYGAEVLLRTSADLNIPAFALNTEAELQALVYDGFGGPTVDPSKGTVFVFDAFNQSSLPSLSLGTSFEQFGFHSGLQVDVYMNVTAGTSTMTYPGACSVLGLVTGDEIDTLPAPLRVDPSVVTYLPLACF